MRVASRILVRLAEDGFARDALAAIARTPGVSYVGYGIETDREADSIAGAAVSIAREEIARLGNGVSTFAIEARRSATDYTESSMDMNRRVGEAVRLATGLRVDLGAPDVLVRVAVVQSATYVYAHREEGCGGLPVGTAGRVVALLSSGIDSPVAAWRVMRRGASIIGIHFSGEPQTSGRSAEYASSIAGVLAGGGGMGRLYTVAFGDVQRTIALDSPPDFRVLLYRRFMVRIAEEVARREGALALVTGESLGQVASQTLENVAVVDAVATLPILRPLIGSDKQEIVAEARRIGTYDLSIATGDDCCTLFMPRRPATHASIEQLVAAELELDVSGLVARGLEAMTHEDIPSVSYRTPESRRR